MSVLIVFLVIAVFTVVIVGMVVHMVAFGSVFWLIARKVSDAAEAQKPKPCEFCGGTLLPEATACDACGAPRDPKQVAARSTSQNSAR